MTFGNAAVRHSLSLIVFLKWIDYIKIQLHATNIIKIGPLEPEIQPAKGARRHYAGPIRL